ncbi:hypothetical protein [Desulfatiglans anilini]|uniref:hypothetical protein n=1 Tax=Desulfatiglans anilini TaxID=90728 RepID=UPI00040CFBFB|nr:hypothetical protein [Desulfatiglans anilini]
MKEMRIKLSDLWRATLADYTGNEGYIGIDPEGERYHIIVPVDRQIARSVRAGIPPEDGTPFGGYSGWRYFGCLPYEGDKVDHGKDRKAREERTLENGWLIQKWGAALGLEIRLLEDLL